MKKILFALVAVMMLGIANAQEYKLSKSSGRLEIKEVNNVIIEGYNGNEIVFTSRNHSRENDERAKGLRALSSMGLEDNTGIGLSVLDRGEYIEVQQLKKMDGPKVTIKVPHAVKVVYTHTSPYGGDIQVRNFDGALELSTVHNGIMLTNTTGVMQVKTVHGDIDASLGDNLKSAASLVSVHGHVDVALPVAIKANLRLSTNWGEIFVDPDFKIEVDRTGTMVKYSDKVNGKLNGGGIEIELGSTHNNVYLRKK